MRQQSRQQFRSMSHAKVSNPRNGALIGYVGDISEHGLKVLSDAPFVQDEHLHMQMRLGEEKTLQFDLDATCIWSGSFTNNGFFEAGFLLEQPSPEFLSMVDNLRIKNSEAENSEQ